MTLQASSSSRARAERFSFGDIHWNGREARLQFHCSQNGTFEETVRFKTEGDVPRPLLTLLQTALGVSTYKAAAARTIELPAMTPAGRTMAEALYTDGLAEFFVRAGLPYPADVRFEGDGVEAPAAFSPPPTDGRPLVAFGGGKDSYVAGAIVQRALGQEPLFSSVVLSDAVEATLHRTAPSDLLILRRTLDPKLLALKDAFSGHVPITAINILVLTIEGLLRGSGPILFANERSADEPTMAVGDSFANHQYSKSSFFETKVRHAVAEAAPAAPATYSVLRPFSELWIGEKFAQLKEPFGRFTSCNRNFRLAGDADKRWCGSCAKCAFTSLILAPHLSQDEAMTIFGQIMLDREALLPLYRELCGLSEHKPWDCVGTISECQAALYLAAQNPVFAESLAVRELLPILLKTVSENALRAQVDAAMKPDPQGALPDALFEAALALS